MFKKIELSRYIVKQWVRFYKVAVVNTIIFNT